MGKGRFAQACQATLRDALKVRAIGLRMSAVSAGSFRRSNSPWLFKIWPRFV